MGIIFQTDKRSGITYAYENKAFWDKEKKQSRSKRTLIGRVDPDTGEIVPTDGRCKKRSPSSGTDNSSPDYKMPKTMKELRAEVRRLLAENHDLRRQVEELTSRLSS
jgi:hypothetical protein